MVGKYSPEPQKESDENFHIEGAGAIVLDSSEDDDMADNNSVLGGNFEYELLPQEPHLGLIEDNDSRSPDNRHVDSPQDNQDLMETAIPNHNDMSTATECITRARPEMEINADEVRAAMRNVTLPPSSFPPWASSISESQLTEYVFMRINRRPTTVQSSSEHSLP